MVEAPAPSIAPGADPNDEHLLEIIGHLGVALMQVQPDDDKIVVGHMRAAYDHAVSLHRAHPFKTSASPAEVR